MNIIEFYKSGKFPNLHDTDLDLDEGIVRSVEKHGFKAVADIIESLEQTFDGSLYPENCGFVSNAIRAKLSSRSKQLNKRGLKLVAHCDTCGAEMKLSYSETRWKKTCSKCWYASQPETL